MARQNSPKLSKQHNPTLLELETLNSSACHYRPGNSAGENKVKLLEFGRFIWQIVESVGDCY